MTLTAVLRIIGVVAAIVGVVDPSWSARRPASTPIDVAIGDRANPAASRVKDELARRLGSVARFDADRRPAAVVVIGSLPDGFVPERGVPVSTVALSRAAAPNVRLADSSEPGQVRIGWAATIRATLEGDGVAGLTTRVVLEDRGVEVARVDHTWTGDRERFDARLRYSPSAPATSTLKVRALPVDGETSVDDNDVHVRLIATDRPFRVLVHERRPSWTTAFVRRALEGDPSFDVSSMVRSSNGLAVRAGDAPAALTSDVLTPFEVILAGAPEDLGASDVAALRSFVEHRGGTVMFLPDRRPSGRYLELLPTPHFDEVLIETPADLQMVGAPLRASELAVYRGSADVEILASYKRDASTRPVVFQVPSGAGWVVFSGALDAWRHRAASDDAFARFWRRRVADAASVAPPRIDVQVAPSVPRADHPLTLTVRLRPTEWDVAATLTTMPRMSARLVDGAGRSTPVRLWPSEEPGTFIGRVAVSAGRYDVEVSTDAGASMHQTLDVLDAAAQVSGDPAYTDETLRLVAQATGGVAVRADDLTPLERHVRELSTQYEDRVIRPARSPLLLLVFAAAVCAEWALRRRRGLV